jgi:hypothetical protein
MRDFLNGPPFAHANSPPTQTPPSFVGNTAKVYSGEWPNNTDLLNSINSTSPLHVPNAFNTQKAHQQPIPLNYSVPPPTMQDFRYPPPYAVSKIS